MKTSACLLLAAAPAVAFQPGVKAKQASLTAAQALQDTRAMGGLVEGQLPEVTNDKQVEFIMAASKQEVPLMDQFARPQEPAGAQYVNEAPSFAAQSAPAEPVAAEPVDAPSSGGWQTALWASLVSMGGLIGALATRHVYKQNEQQKELAAYGGSQSGYQAPLLASSSLNGNGFGQQVARRDMALAAEANSAVITADSAGEPWDPLGLLTSEERYERLRYVEIKHGRISMLAVLGQIVTKAGIRLPGDIDFNGTSFSSIDTGAKAFSQVPAAGWLQMFLFVGFLELFVMKDSANGAPPGDFPGDFRNGFIDFGWDNFTEQDKDRKRGIELNNGRAAMMGILALMVHEQLGFSLWPGEFLGGDNQWWSQPFLDPNVR
jgi:hypothetical protein